MKLLITTQAVDANDPVLGFFHGWLAAFAGEFERIEVICLREGTHALPSNVRVHSLGKERSREKGGQRMLARVMYAWRFLGLAWKLRRDYDVVLVHMNPEHIAVAGDLWRILGKKVGLWYNHEVGSIWLRLAAPLIDAVFHTSPYAYAARYKNARRMPAGIDTELFALSAATRIPRSLYFQGRVAPAKRVHVLLAALRLLRDSVPATATIVGPEDAAYGATLRTEFGDLIEAKAVAFEGPKPYRETPRLYGTHEVAINLTADGNFDKSVLEALATGTPVIVGSKAFSGLVPPEWTVSPEDAPALAERLKALLLLPPEARKALGKEGREGVEKSQSLAALTRELGQWYGAQRPC